MKIVETNRKLVPGDGRNQEMKMQEEKKPTLEEYFEQLEGIIGRMEDGNVTLDQSFELYKEGLQSVRAANAMLDDMEKAMLVLNEEGGLEEF